MIDNDRKKANNLYSAAHAFLKDDYQEFKVAISDYISGIKKIEEEPNQQKKQKDLDIVEGKSFFEKLEEMPRENFVKCSPEMEKIANDAKIEFKRIENDYLRNGNFLENSEACKKEIAEKIRTYHEIVDRKRGENIELDYINKMIEEGVKYKYIPQKMKDVRFNKKSKIKDDFSL